MSQPSWEKDPTTRHEYRWWDGEQWTEHVGDNGVASLDPLTGAENLNPPKPRTAPPPASSGPADQRPDTSGQAPELATRFSRLGARLIDAIILGVLWTGILLLLHASDVRPMPMGELSDTSTAAEISDSWEDYAESVTFLYWWLLVAVAVYEIAFVALRGQTLGKMATGIQVVRKSDLFQPEWGRPPSWGHSLARWVVPFVLGLPAFVFGPAGQILAVLCYLSLTWHRDRQGWHDMAAKTLVIKKP